MFIIYTCSIACVCKNTIIGKENKEYEYYYASRHILNSNTSRRFKIFAFFFFNSFDEKRQLFQKISSKSIKNRHTLFALFILLSLRRRRRRFRRCFTKTIIDDERRGNLDSWRRGWEYYYREHSKTTSACIDDEFESKSTSIRCVRIRAKFNEKVEKHSQQHNVVASNEWRLKCSRWF